MPGASCMHLCSLGASGSGLPARPWLLPPEHVAGTWVSPFLCSRLAVPSDTAVGGDLSVSVTLSHHTCPPPMLPTDSRGRPSPGELCAGQQLKYNVQLTQAIVLSRGF